MKNTITNRIAFIDSHIANHQSLIAQLPQGTQAIILDAHRDGIEQILVALQGKTNLDAIDILSHGSPGTITLGSGVLNNDNLDDYAEQLEQIGQHLKHDGDILLYGCEVAKGAIGQEFIEQLSLLTGADVAASTTLTGAPELGGDWMLDAQIGAIQTKAMQLSYENTLAIINGTSGNDTLTGTTSDDILTGGQGNDKLVGGFGNDIAVFSGNMADYEFSTNAAGQVVVKDLNPVDGDEGTDTLSAIQIARFADGDVKISSIGGEFRVNTDRIHHKYYPTITALSDGGFVVSWISDYQVYGGSYDIYAQRYSANGTAQGSEFLVNTYVTSNQYAPTITALTDGGFVVSWMSAGQDGSGSGIYAQRYSASGAAQGSEFRVNTYVTDSQYQPTITALSNGGFVVNWTSYNQDGSSGGIYAQRYDVNGVKQGSEFRVNTYVTNNQDQPTITALTDGGFVVSWQSGVVPF